MNDISRTDWNAMSDENIARQIGEFVRHHRQQQNRTQAMFAKDAGISRSTLSLLERGETVTVATLIRVMRVLDRLQAFDGFTIAPQLQSPIQLAEAERKRKQRVALPRKKATDNNDETDW